MMKLNQKLTKSRECQDLKLKDISKVSGLDQALISKYENGKRIPPKSHLSDLALAYDISIGELKKLWLAEKVYELMKEDHWDQETMQVLESRIEYLLSEKVLKLRDYSDEITQKLKVLDDLKSKWEKNKPLSGTQLRKLEEYFKISYTHESNKIEGNTLSLQETKLVIEDGLTIGGKSMNEHLEAINHGEAVEFIKAMVMDNEAFNERNVLSVHNLILRGIDRANAGIYRSVPVRISGSEHLPPQPYLVPKMMEEYFEYYNKYRSIHHPVILAAEMHERLVSIHPFIDGNGRTARLLMNFILLRNGYTIANLKGCQESRLAYYKSLEQVQADNNVEPFYHLILDYSMSSLKEHLELAG